MQALEVIINEKEITLINLYGPNNDDQTFFDQLEKFINDHNKNLHSWGDFNTVINENIDKRNGRVNTHKLCRQAINIIDTHNLIDIWREMHPNLNNLLGTRIRKHLSSVDWITFLSLTTYSTL